MAVLFLKNMKYKCIVFLGVMMVIFYTLIELESMEVLMAFRTVFGGGQLFRPIRIISFMVFIALIQYLHIDSIMVIFKNDVYLSIRYKTHTLIFRKLLANMFITNMICVILVFAAWFFSLLISSYDIKLVEWGVALEIILRGYFTCTVVVLVQSIFLLSWNEMSTYMGMTLFSAFFVLLSYTDFSLINICPFLLDNKMLIINIIFCVIYILIGLFFYRKKYKEREVGKYGN